MATDRVFYLNDKESSFSPKILNDNYIKSNQFCEIGFECSDLLLNDEDILVIFEPVKIGEIHYSIYKVWKRYFEIHFPLSTIIVMGFVDHQSSNYLDLLNLPADFQAFVASALPPGADWDVPIECMDALKSMRQFFRGHGEVSLISQLNKIQQSLNVAYVTVAEREKNFQEIKDSLLIPYLLRELGNFRIRWDNYCKLLKYLPFFPVMESIDAQFTEITDFFQTGDINGPDFLDQHFDDSIRQVMNELRKVDRTYIRPELYNEN